MFIAELFLDESVQDERFLQQVGQQVAVWAKKYKAKNKEKLYAGSAIEPGTLGKITGIKGNTDAEKHLLNLGILFFILPKDQGGQHPLGAYRPAKGNWGGDIAADLRYLVPDATLNKTKSGKTFKHTLLTHETDLASTVAHELRHALDDYLSKGKYDSSAHKFDYYDQTLEINAFFTQALKSLQEMIDAGTVDQDNLQWAIRRVFYNNELISDLILDKDPRVKRLFSRAYTYFAQSLENKDEIISNRRPKKVTEDQQVSTEDMINYIRKHHDNNLHSDYTSYIANTFIGFELKDVSVNSLKTNLPKLDQAKVEQYKTMDFSKAPPIVVGDGNILDGYHRANVAKALGIPTIRAYVGIKDVTEVTLVPTVAKSKRQHLDVMPNDGRPIPKGQEAEHLGEPVADMGSGLELWSWASHGTVTYYVFDTATRTSQLGTTGRPYKTNRNSFVIQGVYSGPDNQYRAADLYAFLILNQGLTLVSDNKQSTGGYRVWQELESRYGQKLNIHGFDTRTNEPVNVTTQDEPDTHVDRSDVKRAGPQMKRELGSISRDLRFVASAK